MKKKLLFATLLFMRSSFAMSDSDGSVSEGLEDFVASFKTLDVRDGAQTSGTAKEIQRRFEQGTHQISPQEAAIMQKLDKFHEEQAIKQSIEAQKQAEQQTQKQPSERKKQLRKRKNDSCDEDSSSESE